MRHYALRLLAYESQARFSGKAVETAEWRIFEALRRSLSTLVGVNGFRVLVTRALTLAKAEMPSLADLRVNAEGYIELPASQPDAVVAAEPQVSEAGIVLVTHLLTLLAAFIGENLLVQILLDVWPDFGSFDSVTPGEIDHDPTR